MQWSAPSILSHTLILLLFLMQRMNKKYILHEIHIKNSTALSWQWNERERCACIHMQSENYKLLTDLWMQHATSITKNKLKFFFTWTKVWRVAVVKAKSVFCVRQWKNTHTQKERERIERRIWKEMEIIDRWLN